MAIAAAALLSFGVIAAAHGASTATPTVGYYEAPLGGIKHLTFGLYDYRFLHVGGMTIEERQPTSRILDYFDGYAIVHAGKFIFGSQRGRILLASGEWTAND